MAASDRPSFDSESADAETPVPRGLEHDRGEETRQAHDRHRRPQSEQIGSTMAARKRRRAGRNFHPPAHVAHGWDVKEGEITS